MAHPGSTALEDTYARVAAGLEALGDFGEEYEEAPATISDATDGGFVARDDLLGNSAALRSAFAGVSRNLGTDRADVRATWVFEAYVGAVALATASAIVVDGRLPDCGAAAVRVRFDELGHVPEVRFVTSAFTALEADPAAAEADGLVPEATGLLRRFHLVFVQQHLPPLVTSLNTLTGRPASALWRSAGDFLGQAFLAGGLIAGDMRRGVALGRQFLALPSSPYRATMRDRAYQTTREPIHVRLRDGCCLAWRGESDRTCTLCPRTTEAERAARLAAV